MTAAGPALLKARRLLLIRDYRQKHATIWRDYRLKKINYDVMMRLGQIDGNSWINLKDALYADHKMRETELWCEFRRVKDAMLMIGDS